MTDVQNKIPNYPVGLAVSSDREALRRAPYRDEAISELIRETLIHAGLGENNPTALLAGIIKPGMTVLLKPNWVLHCNHSGQGMECMVTHPRFLTAALREVLAARPGKIILGDAPIQGCKWDQLVSEQFRQTIQQIATDCPVEFIDFRRTIMTTDTLANGTRTEVREIDDYVLFDLGTDSLLEPISIPEGRFRVTMYDPEKLTYSHRPGRHQYVLCREAFEADVLINLPKLKTHRKAGLTAALKNLVGISGNKDYLPHHRLGGSDLGGDCYPGSVPWKLATELYLDKANKCINTAEYQVWASRAEQLLNLYSRFYDRDIEGGWYGNDTVWRMVLDLNRILIYGRADGTMSDMPQRTIWSLTDAIVIGEGEGPLAPKPRLLGAVTFSGSTVASDLLHAALLRMDCQRIPLLREATKPFRWPLTQNSDPLRISLQNREISMTEAAARIGIDAQPPSGWAGHCEMEEARTGGKDFF